MPKGIKNQRDKNITVWIARKYHKIVRKEAFEMGVSITYVLGKIIGEYYERRKK